MLNTIKFNEDKVHSPVRWFGGKHNLSKNIMPLLPKHHCYVEPFGGGGHVLTRKEPSKVEVWNDIDEELINFLMQLRNDKDRMVKALMTLPTSRALCEKWQKEADPEDDFERAVRWFYILRQTIVPANNHDSGWRSGKVKNTAFDFQNAVNRLNEFQERISKVMIECLDFKEIIRRYDSEETLFLIDPPYVGRENLYKGGFTKQDHIELAKLLNSIKGKALVTYYDDTLINDLYQGWTRVEVAAIAGTGVTKAELGQKKKRATEVFFMNYDENGDKINRDQKEITFVPKSKQEQLALF